MLFFPKTSTADDALFPEFCLDGIHGPVDFLALFGNDFLKKTVADILLVKMGNAHANEAVFLPGDTGRAEKRSACRIDRIKKIRPLRERDVARDRFKIAKT